MKKILSVFLFVLFFVSIFLSTPYNVAAKKADPNDPYAFPWCMEHDGCNRFGISNQTDSWLQVYATNLMTGEEEFFTIRSGDKVFLKGRPGPYMWDFVWWCDGEMDTWHVPQAPLTSYWIIYFRCPAGYAGSWYRMPLKIKVNGAQPPN